MTSALMMDTQPIPVDALTEAAWTKLREILKMLNDIREENRRQSSAPRRGHDPWAVLDHGRTYRIVMLDGPRGTGKTSLLLTLIDQWARRRDPKRWRTDRPKRELLRDDDVGVRALTPLDFDPHPEHLHPYAWLVLAFHSVVEWLAHKDERRGRDELDERPLAETWQKLYTQALIGWDADVQREQMATDIDNFVAASLESHQGWHQLRPAWQAFIDGLLAGLERHGELEPDDLLVLPIDDLDLHPSMASDLLRALRLMRHRRLVFVLTGDSEHLRKVLTRELLPCHTLEDASEGRREYKHQYYTKLASDIIDKAIPEPVRFPVPLVTFAQALSFIVHGRDIEPSMQYEEHVERLLDQSIGDPALLARWIARMDEQNYRYRDVVKIRHTTSRADLEALCLLTQRRDGTLVLAREPNPGISGFVRDLECELRVNVSYPQTDRTDEDSRIVVATAINPVLEPGNVAALGATYVLEYLRPRLIRGTEVPASEWSELQITDWSASDPELPARVLWPDGEPPRDLAELESKRQLLFRLSELIEAHRPTRAARTRHAPQTSASARFLAWCWLNILGRPDEPEQLVDMSLWEALDRLPFGSRRRRGDFLRTALDWCENRLPLLAAPEFGLPLPLAEQLIAWTRNWSGRRRLLDADFVRRLNDVRHTGLRQSFARELGQRADTDARAKEAMDWLAQRHADHPWYRFEQEPAGPISLPASPTSAEPTVPAPQRRKKKTARKAGGAKTVGRKATTPGTAKKKRT